MNAGSVRFDSCDELGPDKVIQIWNPQTTLQAVLVIDNVAAGPSIGGVRMAPDVTVHECARLARAMTLKNAANRWTASDIVGDQDRAQLATRIVDMDYLCRTQNIAEIVKRKRSCSHRRVTSLLALFRVVLAVLVCCNGVPIRSDVLFDRVQYVLLAVGDE